MVIWVFGKRRDPKTRAIPRRSSLRFFPHCSIFDPQMGFPLGGIERFRGATGSPVRLSEAHRVARTRGQRMDLPMALSSLNKLSSLRNSLV